jgi:hypothetical protein
LRCKIITLADSAKKFGKSSLRALRVSFAAALNLSAIARNVDSLRKLLDPADAFQIRTCQREYGAPMTTDRD